MHWFREILSYARVSSGLKCAIGFQQVGRDNVYPILSMGWKTHPGELMRNFTPFVLYHHSPVQFLTRLICHLISYLLFFFLLNKKLKLKFRILTNLDWPDTAQIFIGMLPYILTTSAFTFLSKIHHFL